MLAVFGLHQLWLAVLYARAERLRPGPVPEPDARAPLDPRRCPTVTVQLPLYNERFVACRLLDACARLDWPAERLEIQVLDDSSDDTPEIVAARVVYWRARGIEVVHVRRGTRAGFKAGALAAGLRTARGDWVAVFDADFVPDPDFLRRTAPAFEDPHVGLVQARWAHLNAGASVLTRAQSAFLDAHFVVEQGGRAAGGLCFGFNGTAGVWRRACIDAAGGWRADTLTEDLDLSYRAQLRGWRFRFLADVGVPAELPETAAAWRQQQFRWTKGTAETSRLLLRRVLRSRLPGRVRLAAALHLCSYWVYPAALLAALLHAPVLLAHAAGAGPSDAYVAGLGVGLVAFAAMALAHGLAQRALYPEGLRRLAGFPAWCAAGVGLALHNTVAVAEAWAGRRTPFLRTPKGGYGPTGAGVPWGEAALAAYALAGLGALGAAGAWGAVPFQALFAAGFGLAAGFDAWQAFRARSVPSGALGSPAAPARGPLPPPQATPQPALAR